MSINQAERALRAWPILTKRAYEGETITYGELGALLGIHHRPVRYILGLIQDYCLKEKLPPLTILVVNQGGKPSTGFIAYDVDKFEEGKSLVHSYNWSSIPNPFAFASGGTATNNRKSFIQSQGATCANWTWSWSFVNVEKQTVIFGAWDKNTEGSRSLILSEAWATNRAGRKSPAYPQSREHIRLVEEQGYKLLTFPIIFSDELQDEDGFGPAKIKGFEPVLTQKSLVRVGGSWYASDDAVPTSIAEEVSNPERFVEGAAKTIAVNAYERNSKARSACIKHYGAVCAVCNFNFEAAYGAIGKGFIHVHHIVPLAEIRRQYELDPIRDLIPVCPNCHAIIHLTQPAMSIDELRSCLHAPRNA